MGVRHDPNMRYELALSNPKEFYHEVIYGYFNRLHMDEAFDTKRAKKSKN